MTKLDIDSNFQIRTAYDFMVIIQYHDVVTAKPQTYTQFVRSSLDTVAIKFAILTFREEYLHDRYNIINVYIIPSMDPKYIKKLDDEVYNDLCKS